MDNSFKALIDSAQETLILLPSNPSFDQVSSALSTFISLRLIGKKSSITCLSPMTAEFSRLIGVDKISEELGNKNLVIRFINYIAEDVDKVRADVESEQFTLTVLPKEGKKAPTKEQVDMVYSGSSSDLIILVGGAYDTDFPQLTSPDLNNSKIVHIGTKLLEVSSNLQILSFARPSSSISELTAILIKESGYAIDPDIATNLLSGIEEQSHSFQGPDVTSDTFLIFAELLKMGGIRHKRVEINSFPKGSIPTKPFSGPQTPPIMKVEEEKKPVQQEVPQSWTEPKIYTGTTIN